MMVLVCFQIFVLFEPRHVKHIDSLDTVICSCSQEALSQRCWAGDVEKNMGIMRCSIFGHKSIQDTWSMKNLAAEHSCFFFIEGFLEL